MRRLGDHAAVILLLLIATLHVVSGGLSCDELVLTDPAPPIELISRQELHDLPPFFSTYAAFHRHQLRRLAADRSTGVRVLVLYCETGGSCGGLGDRFLGAANALYLALATRRVLLLRQWPVPLSDTLLPRAIDWLTLAECAHRRADVDVYAKGDAFNVTALVLPALGHASVVAVRVNEPDGWDDLLASPAVAHALRQVRVTEGDVRMWAAQGLGGQGASGGHLADHDVHGWHSQNSDVSRGKESREGSWSDLAGGSPGLMGASGAYGPNAGSIYAPPHGPKLFAWAWRFLFRESPALAASLGKLRDRLGLSAPHCPGCHALGQLPVSSRQSPLKLPVLPSLASSQLALSSSASLPASLSTRVTGDGGVALPGQSIPWVGVHIRIGGNAEEFTDDRVHEMADVVKFAACAQRMRGILAAPGGLEKFKSDDDVNGPSMAHSKTHAPGGREGEFKLGGLKDEFKSHGAIAHATSSPTWEATEASSGGWGLDGIRLYVASDSTKAMHVFRDEMSRVHGADPEGVVFIDDAPPFHVERSMRAGTGHHRYTLQEARDRTVDTMAEFMLLSQATCVVASISGFSRIPIDLSRDLVDGTRCMAHFEHCTDQDIRRSLVEPVQLEKPARHGLRKKAKDAALRAAARAAAGRI
eukprot:jgi/Mesvir1/6561/Mv16819-RA.1